MGSEGTLRLSPAFMADDGELRLGDGRGRSERIDLPPTSRFQLELENFARAVRGEEPPLLRPPRVGRAGAHARRAPALGRERRARARGRLKPSRGHS